jgi:predicted house-cleaning noncanonical NTP pyrophosphatase (MazG superfamily)
MQFYSVKERRIVEVPREQVRAHRYERITKSGKRQVCYALRAEFNGQQLTKFVDEATYLEYLSDDEEEQLWDEAFARSQDLLARMAEEAIREYRAGETQPLFKDDE